ncbi:hypothetical protein THOM_0456, partial [Trachipleistophora hominis]
VGQFKLAYPKEGVAWGTPGGQYVISILLKSLLCYATLLRFMSTAR